MMFLIIHIKDRKKIRFKKHSGLSVLFLNAFLIFLQRLLFWNQQYRSKGTIDS